MPAQSWHFYFAGSALRRDAAQQTCPTVSDGEAFGRLYSFIIGQHDSDLMSTYDLPSIQSIRNLTPKVQERILDQGLKPWHVLRLAADGDARAFDDRASWLEHGRLGWQLLDKRWSDRHRGRCVLVSSCSGKSAGRYTRLQSGL